MRVQLRSWRDKGVKPGTQGCGTVEGSGVWEEFLLPEGHANLHTDSHWPNISASKRAACPQVS